MAGLLALLVPSIAYEISDIDGLDVTIDFIYHLKQ